MKGREKLWKSLRATFATAKVEAEVDVPSLAALMGLTTAHVLKHYVKPSGAHLAVAMASPPKRFRAGPATNASNLG